MSKQIDCIEIEGVKYMPVEQANMAKRNGMDFVCVRTYSAGVHCGYLESRNGKEVILRDSIRIWYWDGAFTLSEFAKSGVKKPDTCKFGVPLDKIILTEAIEIIPCTEEARKSIQSVEPKTADEN